MVERTCRRPGLEELVAELRRKGYRLTYTRLEVLRAIASLGEKHPSLTEVYEAVRKRVPALSFTTVYNTVRLLESLGVILVFEHGGDKRIDLVTEPHVNIIDTGTGEIKDYCNRQVVELIREVSRLVERETGAKPERLIVMLYV